MKYEKLVEYLFSSKKKKLTSEITLEEREKYDARLLAFLSSEKIDGALHRKILLNIPTKVLPKMANPLLLADFLTSSYQSQGNASKILALHGLYLLMTQCNLDYPFFYGKLYSLLTIDIFTAKYKARFFYLLNIFLQSSHLPANLVASFAKRLARLALWVPQYDQNLLMTFIYNLIVRHPSIRVMIDRKTTEIIPVTEDPYLEDECDPTKSNAILSSLWEIESLTQHHHPDIANAALMLISLRKTHQERDIHDLLEIDYDEMFDHDIRRSLRTPKKTEKKKSNEQCPINFDVSVSLF